MAAVTNNTQPQTLITRNQTLLFAKDGSLFEALASIYSIDIPTLSKDETTGQTKGTGKVTGLFNRMLTIPFTNTSNLVSDMMNDVKTVDANTNVIYNVSIVRNADRTISPVFERANLRELISLQGWATSEWCNFTFATKGHNHTEYAKSCAFSDGKFTLRNANGDVLSSASLTGLSTEGHTHKEYIKSVSIDNNGVLKFNYEQHRDAKTIDLKKYYSSTGHTHNNYIDSVSITSDGYIQLKNGTSVKSSVDLKSYYSSTGHTHNNYITSVNINNGVIRLYNGSYVKSSVDLKSYYSSSKHTHSYVTSIKFSDASKKITVTIEGKDEETIDLSKFNTNDEVKSKINKAKEDLAKKDHKHTAIYRGVESSSSAFWYSSSALYTGGLDIYKSSDIRLKDHITSISASEKLEHFVKFNWKETGKVSYGVIAQEVEKNHPELVTTQENGFKAVSYDVLLCYQLGVLIEKLKNKGVVNSE